ncbi:NUDIX hydrolase [Mogibacterium diversum]|uniref:NUDIX hydrolase n=1 Tax=Mogibacterium diversum TaxID=114527 RepID=UPI0028E73F05|nr:NUDIX domain-containing protein [Mogibacterium diversum]
MTYDINSSEEREYLEDYNIEQFERPSVATDIVAFAVMQDGEQSNIRKLANRELKLLLVKRSQFPYKGAWALPGGFLRPGETIEETAKRELLEETGVENPFLHLAGVYSEAGRDPRGWIISNSFISLINAENCSLRADTDAWDAAWFCVKLQSDNTSSDDSTSTTKMIKHTLTLSFDSASSDSNIKGDENIEIKAIVSEKSTRKGHNHVSSYQIVDSGELGFDHAKIIVQSLLELRDMMEYDLRIAFDLLPESFTLAQLQSTIEKVTDKKFLSANFRRKASDYVEETGEVIEGYGHRPAMLFRVKSADHSKSC